MSHHEHEPEHEHEHEHDLMDDCIEACLHCHVVCTMTVQYAVSEGGELAELNRIGLMLDSAQICQTSADFLVRGSPYYTLTCSACADICRACADACREIEGDEHMAHCVEACESCADLCEQMAASGAEDEEEE